MSALEQFSPSPADRRRNPRLHLKEIVPVRIARSDGTLVDLSVRGARVRHKTAVGRGTTVRLTFSWRGRLVAATATVLASRVVALDGPTYESRLQFAIVPHESEAALRQILAAIENEDVRRAVENMQGESTDARAAQAAQATPGFTRCRYIGNRWQKKWTRSRMQPHDGFTLPAALSEIEVTRVCRSYESIDANARELLRSIAEAILTE